MIGIKLGSHMGVKFCTKFLVEYCAKLVFAHPLAVSLTLLFGSQSAADFFVFAWRANYSVGAKKLANLEGHTVLFSVRKKIQ